MNGTRPSDLNELSLLSATVRFLGCRLVETARLCTGAAVKSREGSINNKFAHFGERHIASARFLHTNWFCRTSDDFCVLDYFILYLGRGGCQRGRKPHDEDEGERRHSHRSHARRQPQRVRRRPPDLASLRATPPPGSQVAVRKGLLSAPRSSAAAGAVAPCPSQCTT